MLVDAATGALREMFSAGRAEAACMVALSRTEVLAVKDSTGVLVGPDGSAKHKAGGSSPGQNHGQSQCMAGSEDCLCRPEAGELLGASGKLGGCQAVLPACMRGQDAAWAACSLGSTGMAAGTSRNFGTRQVLWPSCHAWQGAAGQVLVQACIMAE